MASNDSLDNGIDGDDERQEDDDAEEKPRLKYQRLGGSVPSVLSNDAAASITVAERMIAPAPMTAPSISSISRAIRALLVCVFCNTWFNALKHQPLWVCPRGAQAAIEYAAHTATVNDISFDSDGEYVGSCSDDGSVVINGLFTDERLKFKYHHTMRTIALDPDFTRKTSRRFVAGGLAGQLILNMKNWLGYGKQVLHDGESPVHAIKWRTSLIAWANDAGDDAFLVIGGEHCVKIAAIKTNQFGGANELQRNISISHTRFVDIVASFQTSYQISGIAPFGDTLVVLAYILDEQNGEKSLVAIYHLARFIMFGTAQRPEVHIVTWKNGELMADALPIHGSEHYKSKDYALAHSPFSGSSYAGGQWAAGDEPLYYIVSPKDVVIARPRDVEDHILWLLQHGWHEKALAAVEAGQGRTGLLDEIHKFSEMNSFKGCECSTP
ncbi:CLH [Musa troglodytarum]|uniref:CLH n=1 Tax=Musa troglodytarum TaxID=320322 RepID=A0A9E7FT11_9LILI|nr:CLH [Musa troglodytarum]